MNNPLALIILSCALLIAVLWFTFLILKLLQEMGKQRSEVIGLKDEIDKINYTKAYQEEWFDE